MTGPVAAALHDTLAARGLSVPPLVSLADHLEAHGHTRTAYDGAPAVAPAPLDAEGAMTTHLLLRARPEDGHVAAWFGRADLDDMVVPVLRCGGDGSYMALWAGEGGPASLVFFGSEGEGFTIAATPADMISVMTMGYAFIETADDLYAPPEAQRRITPAEREIQDWAVRTFGCRYPATASALLPYTGADDPYGAWLATLDVG
ncbi:MAG: hypothetical protein ACU0CO_00585 [Shimia sp.]